MKTPVSVGSEICGRVRRPGHAGLVLAALALCLQLIAPNMHSAMPLALRAGGDELSALLGEHALCLGAVSGAPAEDSDAPTWPPEERHHEFAACCFWHGTGGLSLPRMAVATSIVFDLAGVAFPGRTSAILVPARLSGTFAARAPPVST